MASPKDDRSTSSWKKMVTSLKRLIRREETQLPGSEDELEKKTQAERREWCISMPDGSKFTDTINWINIPNLPEEKINILLTVYTLGETNDDKRQRDAFRDVLYSIFQKETEKEMKAEIEKNKAFLWLVFASQPEASRKRMETGFKKAGNTPYEDKNKRAFFKACLEELQSFNKDFIERNQFREGIIYTGQDIRKLAPYFYASEQREKRLPTDVKADISQGKPIIPAGCELIGIEKRFLRGGVGEQLKPVIEQFYVHYKPRDDAEDLGVRHVCWKNIIPGEETILSQVIQERSKAVLKETLEEKQLKAQPASQSKYSEMVMKVTKN